MKPQSCSPRRWRQGFCPGETAQRWCGYCGRKSARERPWDVLLGAGTAAVGKAFGLTRVAVVKNQAIPSYDPRGCKGNGITYVTSPMGADHTAANTAVDGHLDRLKKDGQIEASRTLQFAVATVDSLGICLFVAGMTVDDPNCRAAMVKMVNARYGLSLDNDGFTNLGKYVLKTEHQFNLNAGFTNKDDRLPEFFEFEPLPPHNAVWDFTPEEIDTFWNF